MCTCVNQLLFYHAHWYYDHSTNASVLRQNVFSAFGCYMCMLTAACAASNNHQATIATSIRPAVALPLSTLFMLKSDQSRGIDTLWPHPSVTIRSDVRSMFASWFREPLYRTISNKISSPLLSFSSLLCVSMVAVSMVLVRKVMHKVWSLFTFVAGSTHEMKFLQTKYL